MVIQSGLIPSQEGSYMKPVLQLLDGVLSLFSMAVVIWCLASWFPNINRRDEPFRTLDRLILPVMRPIQRVIPAIGGIDISPMVLIVGLNFVQRIVHSFF